MNRNESFPASGVSALEINLAWATLEAVTDNVSEIQMLISGNEEDVDDLRVGLTDGVLRAEQPAYGLTAHLGMVRWMQVVIRLPMNWKGAVSLNTVAGPLRARGIQGSDVVLRTVSGDLWGSDLHAITLKMRTVTGALNCREARAEKGLLRTVSGSFQLEGARFRNLKLVSASSDLRAEFDEPFETVEANSVAGNIEILAPVEAANITLRKETGRLRTGGVSITDDGPVIRATTVSGILTVTYKEPR